jgi:hypothetical protein
MSGLARNTSGPWSFFQEPDFVLTLNRLRKNSSSWRFGKGTSSTRAAKSFNMCLRFSA